MGRTKLELIANEKLRKTTFRKRRVGLTKKAYELATLCGTDVLLVCSATVDGGTQPAGAAHTFPENLTEVRQILSRYRATMSKKENHIKKMKKVPSWDDQDSLRGMTNNLNSKMDAIRTRITLLEKENNQKVGFEPLVRDDHSLGSDVPMDGAYFSLLSTNPNYCECLYCAVNLSARMGLPNPMVPIDETMDNGFDGEYLPPLLPPPPDKCQCLYCAVLGMPDPMAVPSSTEMNVGVSDECISSWGFSL